MKVSMRTYALIVAIVLLITTGCGGGGGGNGDSYSTVIVDPTPPSVVYTTPAHNETNVGTNTVITVTFSEAVAEETVEKGSTFKLIDRSIGIEIPLKDSDIVYDANSNLARITPSSPLEGNRQYECTVNPNIITDLAGNKMKVSYSWTFTTAPGPDSISPVLLSRAPVGTGRPTNTSIAMSFSKPMDITTFTPQNFSLKPTGSQTALTGSLTLIGQVVVFTPFNHLNPNTEYTVTLANGLKDLNGNGLSSTYTWKFTTGSGTDSTPPRLESKTPDDNSENVDINTEIRVKFDEPVYPFLMGVIEGKIHRVEFDYDTNTIIMTPTTPLKNNEKYTAFIRARDLSDNLMASEYSWTFKTVAAP